MRILNSLACHQHSSSLKSFAPLMPSDDAGHTPAVFLSNPSITIINVGQTPQGSPCLELQNLQRRPPHLRTPAPPRPRTPAPTPAHRAGGAEPQDSSHPTDPRRWSRPFRNGS